MKINEVQQKAILIRDYLKSFMDDGFGQYHRNSSIVNPNS